MNQVTLNSWQVNGRLSVINQMEIVIQELKLSIIQKY